MNLLVFFMLFISIESIALDANNFTDIWKPIEGHIESKPVGTDLTYTITPTSGAASTYSITLQFWANPGCSSSKGSYTISSFTLNSAQAAVNWYLNAAGLNTYVDLASVSPKSPVHYFNIVDNNAGTTGGCTNVNFDSGTTSFPSVGTPGTHNITKH